MMDFKEFTDKLVQNLKVALEDGPAHASVIRHDVEKMQGQSYTALTVSPADSRGERAVRLCICCLVWAVCGRKGSTC